MRQKEESRSEWPFQASCRTKSEAGGSGVEGGAEAPGCRSPGVPASVPASGGLAVGVGGSAGGGGDAGPPTAGLTDPGPARTTPAPRAAPSRLTRRPAGGSAPSGQCPSSANALIRPGGRPLGGPRLPGGGTDPAPRGCAWRP